MVSGKGQLKVSETALQNQVKALLINLGYTVMETGKGRSRQTCSRCGNKSYATGWQGNTRGLPDLYIHRQSWPRGRAVAVELKTPTGTIRKEQKELADAGLTYICRSVGCVIDVLVSCERDLQNDSQVTTLEKVKDINGF